MDKKWKRALQDYWAIALMAVFVYAAAPAMVHQAREALRQDDTTTGVAWLAASMATLLILTTGIVVNNILPLVRQAVIQGDTPRMSQTQQKQTVYKYQLSHSIGAPQEVDLPKDAAILHVDDQAGVITLWAQVDPHAPLVTRRFAVFGTGDDLPQDAVHRGTLLQHPYVWHIYELSNT